MYAGQMDISLLCRVVKCGSFGFAAIGVGLKQVKNTRFVIRISALLKSEMASNVKVRQRVQTS